MDHTMFVLYTAESADEKRTAEAVLDDIRAGKWGQAVKVL